MVLTYPNKMLKEPASPINPMDALSNEIQTLIDRMIDTMYLSGGLGLAANQIGENKRIFVYDKDGNPEAMINPEVLDEHGESKYTEACLSVPFFSGVVKRSVIFRIKGVDDKGQDVIINAGGMLARVFQHEIDHLNGILILDRVSQFHRDRYRKNLKRRLRRAKRRKR